MYDGSQISHMLVSKVTEAVIEQLEQWQSRELEEL